MRKKAKKILVGTALIMSLCVFTACGTSNNTADEADINEENTTDNNGTEAGDNLSGNGAAEDGMTDSEKDKQNDPADKNNDGTVSGELGNSVRDLGEGVGDAVEDVGDAVGNAAEGR